MAFCVVGLTWKDNYVCELNKWPTSISPWTLFPGGPARGEAFGGRSTACLDQNPSADNKMCLHTKIPSNYCTRVVHMTKSNINLGF